MVDGLRRAAARGISTLPAGVADAIASRSAPREADSPDVIYISAA